MTQQARAVDPAHIGKIYGCVTADVEQGALRQFARAIGETAPVYTELAAALEARHESLPAPPTYFFCLQMREQANPTAWLGEIGVDLQQVLHGEQGFEYLEMAYAGDRLAYQSVITDIYEKKGGALTFIVTCTSVHNQFGVLVCRMRQTLAVRQRAGRP